MGRQASTTPHLSNELDSSSILPSDGALHDQTQSCAHLGDLDNEDMFLHDIQVFLKHYGPHKLVNPDDDITECVQRLSSGEKPLLKLDEAEHYAWTGFPVKSGKENSGSKFSVFQPLQDIVDAVLDDKPSCSRLKFTLCPSTSIDIDGGNHLIDAYFMDKPHVANAHISHRDIQVPIVLKKSRRKDRKKVHQQVLGACHHILNEDPRRMWIYGLTFEGNYMTVWYFSRSHSVETVPYNWMKDVRTFVHILLSLSRATPAELGMDPHVQLGPLSDDGVTMSYVYEIPDKDAQAPSVFYKTRRNLFTGRSISIAGRNTRVWEVVQVTCADGLEVVNPLKKAVLKDVWLDADASTEAENMDAIFAAVDALVKAGLEVERQNEQKANPNFVETPQMIQQWLRKFIDKKEQFKHFKHPTKDRLQQYFTDEHYKSLFLTKLHDYSGVTSKPLAPGVMHFPTLFPKETHMKDPNATKTQTETHAQQESNRTVDHPPFHGTMTRPQAFSAAKIEGQAARQFVPKRQSRFVYEEVCMALHKVPTVGVVVDILSQAVDALHILYSVGWVHRDISAGNILALPTSCGWKMKLADLEFSRVMIDTTRMPRSDPRTGTVFYMPTEVLNRYYLFEDFRGPPPLPSNTEATTQYDLDSDDSETELSKHVSKDASYAPLQAFTDIPFKFKKLPADLHLSRIPLEMATVNHNFQHDLESIWWILLWFITSAVNCDQSKLWALPLFQHDVEHFHARVSAFGHKLQVKLARGLGPNTLFTEFPLVIENLRKAMYKDCILRPLFGQLDVPESYSKIHETFSRILHNLNNSTGAWKAVPVQFNGRLGFIQLPGTGAGVGTNKRRHGALSKKNDGPIVKKHKPNSMLYSKSKAKDKSTLSTSESEFSDSDGLKSELDQLEYELEDEAEYGSEGSDFELDST